MPQAAQKQNNYYYGNIGHSCGEIYNSQMRVYRTRKVYYGKTGAKMKSRKYQQNRFLARILAFGLVVVAGVFILPTAFKNITLQMIFKSPNNYIKTDYSRIVFPTLSYLNNNLFLGEYLLSGAADAKKSSMSELLEGEPMPDLEKQIIGALSEFPSIEPSIFVWDYETGDYVDVNSSQMYSAASIIKIPVLISLFKSVETNQLSLDDTMVLKSYYRAEGSGDLQYKAENALYSIDNLARIMITDSDNSSTNMIMAKLGSMTTVNSQIHNWGLNKTQVHTWLPDLEGTNLTTAKELARMLYNIENPDFLSENSRLKIKDYMSHVKNNRLIAAGLGQGASFIHKTGDIGKMLGDAGIVTMPSGKKYIVVILVNRPYNSPVGKDFIVKASEIIYSYMSTK